jgi:tetratricopeptide (TPR) repeat protein
MKNKNFSQAVYIYDAILKLLPTQETCLLNMGLIYYQAERYSKAIPYLEKVSTQLQKDSHFLELLGEAYFQSGEYDKALKVFTTGLSLVQNNADLSMGFRLKMGKCLYKKKYFDQAVSIYTV